jgi:tripartite-type tricarboxylate transporter receptor subunit TctC
MWWVPVGTPQAAIDVLADGLEKAMQDERVNAQFANRNIEPIFLRGEELKTRVERAASTIEALVEDYDLRSN